MKEVRMKMTKNTKVMKTPTAKLPAPMPATSLEENSRSEGLALGEAPSVLVTISDCLDVRRYENSY